MQPNPLQALRPIWRALGKWSARTPRDHDPTRSNGRSPEPDGRARGRNTAADPGGGAALELASVVPPPLFSPIKPGPATPDSREHSTQPAGTGHDARLSALIATLPSPDREIVLLRLVAGASIPDIVATLGVTPDAVHLAQHQALKALQPPTTTNGPSPGIRKRVVLLPHAQTKPDRNLPCRGDRTDHRPGAQT